MKRELSVGALAASAVLGVGAPAAWAAAPDKACPAAPYSAPSGSGTTPGCTTRVSQTYRNGDANGTSQRPRISEDGNHVVFQSAADNLTPNSPSSRTHVYEANTANPAGSIRLVDVGARGATPNGLATFVDVSANGRYVVFYSAARNLVAGRATRTGSVFLRDMTAGKTVEVPQSASGGETNGYSTRPTISAYPDGGGNYYVAYNSKGTNLVTGARHVDDVYVTRVNGSSLAVSKPMLVSHVPGHATTPSNGKNEHAEISSYGDAIVWDSDATNLDRRANGKTQVYESANPFLRSATPGLASVSSSGVIGNAPSTRPSVDGHGDEVAWQSVSNNLVPGDTNGVLDSFVRGTQSSAVVGSGRTVRVSLSYTGGQLNGATQRPNLDGRGDVVAFASNSHDVVKGDNNGQRDVFRRNLRSGRNTLIDVCKTGGFAGGHAPCPRSSGATTPAAPSAPTAAGGGEDLSSRAFLSYDGKTAAFISGMSNLVPQDGNAGSSLDDIFVRTFSG